MTPPHLFVALTGHGFGHAAMTAPVVQALCRSVPDLRVTVQATVPQTKLRELYGPRVGIVAEAPDPGGLPMHSALAVDRAASLDLYRAADARLPEAIAAARAGLQRLRPTAVLANIPYAVFPAARALGIPALGLACLNWADVLAHYAGDEAGIAPIVERIHACYDAADVLLVPEPAMDMPRLRTAVSIGPVARLGRADRAGLCARLGWPPGTRPVVVTLGGVATAPPPLPRLDGVGWLASGTGEAHGRDDIRDPHTLDWPFIDVLASAAAVVVKPGYGLFTEAACNGIPVAYVRRDDWPEEANQIAWLHRSAVCCEVPRGLYASGAIGPALATLWDRVDKARQPSPPRPDGIDAVVRHLRCALGV